MDSSFRKIKKENKGNEKVKYNDDKRVIRAFGSALLVFAMIAFVSEVKADDNQISLEQSGDNFQLDITQIGFNNTVKMLDSASYINNAANLSIYIVQHNNSNAENIIAFDEMNGSGNSLRLGQGVGWNTDGTYTHDGYEGGGHYIEIDLYGSDNSLQWSQTNQGSTDGHEFNFHLAGDDNSIKGKQQSDGIKEMNLTIYNSDNNVELRQHGSWATHNANITLDGLYGTDLLLKQLGTTTQTYNLSVDCVTVGGCAVSVQQGN